MSNFSITIYVDNGGIAGHMYVRLSNGITSYDYGYNPTDEKPATAYGNGVVTPDNTVSRTENYHATKIEYKKINLTESQYNSAKYTAEQIKANPGKYDGFQVTEEGRNCVEFADEILKAAGFYGGVGYYFTDEQLDISYAGKYADFTYGDGSIWQELWEEVKDATGAVSAGINNMSLKTQLITPIGLDLSGNGRIDVYSATSSLNKAFFDIDNDNFKEKVDWLNPVDGWLAMDRNADGKITNQRELFGDSDGKKAYQKLAELNTNNTGLSANSITSADAAWGSLRVWIDSDIDGVSDAGELRTLDSLGITSISLETAAGSKKGIFVQNGVSKLTQDINLTVKQENSWYIGTTSEIKPETLLLPQSRGYGDVKSMHFAASENTTLLTQLKEIANLPISSLDSYYTKLLTMVYNWTGATNITANPIYGQYLDSQHLYAIERFAGIGTDFYAAQLGNNYLLRALSFKWSEGESREAGYESMISEMAVRFSAQGALKSVFGNPSYDFSTDKMVFSTSLAQIITNAKANVPTDSVDKNVYWSEIARTLKLYARDLSSTEATVKTQVDTAAGYNVTINNLGGRYFEGDAGNNTLNGNNNTNYLAGGNGNDTLTGGKGDDYLEGGTGSDLYRYASGDGNDYLCELISGSGSGATDVLQFTNLNRSSLTFSRADLNGEVAIRMNALKIDVAGGGSVLIKDHFLFDANAATNANWRVEQIKFADGTTMDFASSKAATIKLTSGNDTVNGFGDAENFNGLAGNDLIRGFAGNDTLAGGAGNDTLEGGDGNDIIIADVGKDSLRGGTGSDTFTFTNIVDNQAATADYINDFVRGTDKIDVRGLGFTGLDTDGGLTEAGELRFTSDAGGTQTITSDQNGFTFQLYSFSATTDSDFIWLA